MKTRHVRPFAVTLALLLVLASVALPAYAAAPGTVANLRATAMGEDWFELAWDAPEDALGDLTYEISMDGGAYAPVDDSGARKHRIEGLNAGWSVTASVRAKNADGEGEPSELALMPGVGAASAGTVTGVGGTLRYEWSAPLLMEGAEVDRYEVDVNQTGVFEDYGMDTCAIFDNLPAGYPYTIRVRAYIASLDAYTPETLLTGIPAAGATAPKSIAAIPGDGEITVTWAPPADNGGMPVTGYVLSIDGGLTWPYEDADHHTYEQVLTGLENGTVYPIWVAAVTGDGIGSPARIDAAPAVPLAPAALTASAGETEVAFRWEAPLREGMSPVDGYEYSLDGQSWVETSDKEYTVTGLQEGRRVRFFVRAVNAEGAGPFATTTARPGKVPGAPRDLQAEAGNGQAELTWNAPEEAGLPIISYEVSIDQSIWFLIGPEPYYTYGGLRNGVTYDIYLRARNAAGPGPAVSTKATPEAPESAPSAPRNLAAVSGDRRITLQWTAPANNGGSAIIGYDVSMDGAGWVSLGNVHEYTFEGLSNGVMYSFAVRARNDFSWGETASIRATVGVGSVIPDVPRNVRAAAGDAQIRVTWGPPASDGGSAVLYYEISLDRVNWQQVNAREFELVGLTNGQTYTIYVRAVNANGAGPLVTVYATPNAASVVPSAPRDLRVVDAGNDYITINWAPPEAGMPVNFEVYIGGGWIDVGPVTNYRFANLTYNMTYSISVRAYNSIGYGPEASTTGTANGDTKHPVNPPSTTGVINGPAAIYDSADSNGTVVITLDSGTQVKLMGDRNGEWVHISFFDGTMSGWVMGTYIQMD